MKKAIAFGLAAVAVLCLGLVFYLKSRQEEPPIRRQAYGLHTLLNFTIWGIGEADMDDALAEVARFDEIFSRSQSVGLGDLNDADAGEGVELPEEVAGLIKRAFVLTDQTDGAFDVTLGALANLWGIGTPNPYLPTPEEVSEALATSGKEHLTFEGNRAFRDEAGTVVDLGAIVKGYAADRLRDFFLQRGATRGVIDLGGNVMTFGRKPDGSPWLIGVRNPVEEGQGPAALWRLDGSWAVVTSGPYEQYFIRDGIRYHHIFDPATGWPSDSGLDSVTVVAQSGEKADALSTALFVLGVDKGSALLRRAFPDVTALFIQKGVQTVVGPLKDRLEPGPGEKN